MGTYNVEADLYWIIPTLFLLFIIGFLLFSYFFLETSPTFFPTFSSKATFKPGIAACDLKVSTHRQLMDLMKVSEYWRSRSSLDLGPRSFTYYTQLQLEVSPSQIACTIPLCIRVTRSKKSCSLATPLESSFQYTQVVEGVYFNVRYKLIVSTLSESYYSNS